MIEVKYDIDRLRLSVNGHAGYAPNGSDIVCAGVSTLIYTLINSCDCDVYKDTITVHGSSEVYRAVITGLKMISKKYQKNLRLVPYRSNEE